MGQQTFLEVASPQCVAQEFEGEVIALNLTSGTYYSLRDLGAAVWRDLAAGHPVEALAALAGSGHPLVEFAANLQAHGLLRAASLPVTPSAEPQLAAALAQGLADLTFEVYEDMQSLFLLDPVHEVDETRGWPTQPTGGG